MTADLTPAELADRLAELAEAHKRLAEAEAALAVRWRAYHSARALAEQRRLEYTAIRAAWNDRLDLHGAYQAPSAIEERPTPSDRFTFA